MLFSFGWAHVPMSLAVPLQKGLQMHALVCKPFLLRLYSPCCASSQTTGHPFSIPCSEHPPGWVLELGTTAGNHISAMQR